MKLRVALLGLGLIAASCGTASANIIYTFNNAGFSTTASGPLNDGTLTGSFTTNDARNTVISYNIFASAFGSFAGFNYMPSNSSISASSIPSQFFQIDTSGSTNELRLYFSSGLAATGSSALAQAFSYEAEPAGGTRFALGSVTAATAVPSPIAGAGLIPLAGLGAAWFARRRKRVVA